MARGQRRRAHRTQPSAGSAARAKERSGRAFYRVLRTLSRLPVVPAGADFRLLDRRVVDAFNALEEHFVFLRGLIPWFAFRESSVAFEAEPRFAGRSKYRLSPMLRLAFDGIFAFSVMPLRAITALGLLTTLAGVLYGVYWLAAWFAGRIGEAGWTSLPRAAGACDACAG